MTSGELDNVLHKLQKMPRDRGWAWVVLLASWFNNIMVSGIYKTFGKLFIEIQDKFGSTSAKTSLVYSLLNASFSCTSLLVAILDLKTVSARQCISFGTGLACLGYLLAACVPSVDLLIVSLGVGLGVGQGFIFAPQITLIGQYFERWKGLANCVALTGSSAGSLILPYLIGLFVDSYGLSGAFLLLCGLNLNCMVFAALMRPFPMKEFCELSEKSRQLQKTHADTEEVTDSLLNKPADILEHSVERTGLTISDNYGEEIVKGQGLLLQQKHLRKSHQSSLYASSEFIVPSMENVMSYDETNDVKNIEDTSPTCEKLKSKLKSVLNLKVLKTPLFLYYIPFAVLIANGSSMILSFLLPHAKDVGLSEVQLNTLLTLIGVADVVTIPLWGMFADRRYIKSIKLVVIAMTCLAIPSCFISYYTSYATLLVFSLFYGLFGRVYLSLFPVVLVEFLGLENLRSSVAISMVMQAVFHSIMLPIVGLMRDKYGTYTYSYQMMGAFLLVGSAGVLIMPELAIKIHGPHRKQLEHVVE